MKNRFLLLLLLLCSFGFVGNSVGQSVATWDPYWGSIPMVDPLGGGNLTLYSTIYIDGVQVNNANYEIAAFMEGLDTQPDGRVQKLGSKPMMNVNGIYYYASNVNGCVDLWDSPTMNRFCFKIYDHENNVILDATSNYEWDYWTDAIWGSPSDPLPLHFYTKETVWEPVTDASSLVEGDVIMITTEDTDYALGEGNNTGNDRPAWEITLENGTITWVEPTWDDSDDLYSVQEILVHFDSDLSSTDPVLFASRGFLSTASNNQNRLKTNIAANENSIWTITIDEDGLATLVAQGNYTRNNLCYNGSEKFVCAASQLNPVRIYRKIVAPEIVEFNVTASVTPATGGSIQLDGANFTGGTYEAGTTLSLTAVPAEGYNFVNWTVNGTENTENPLALEVNEETTLVAVFEEIPVVYYTLTYSVDPAEGGSIAVNPAPGEQGYEEGTEVSLTATGTDETWIFDEWVNADGEAVCATATYTFNINANTTLVAKFHQEIPVVYYTLTVNVYPENAGTIACNPEPGEQGYEEGTSVTITATPVDGFTFVNWKNAMDETVGTDAEYTFEINANTTLTANFEEVVVVEPHTVTLNAGSGTCTVTELTEAEGGAGVTLPEATPCDAALTAGYTFAGWAAAEVAETTTAPELFNGAYAPEADITLYAVYAMGGYTYTFKNGDNYLAWVSGNSLKTVAEVNDNSKWNVTFDGDNAIITPYLNTDNREIAWNNKDPRFATYKQASVYNTDGSMNANYRAISLVKDGTAVTSLAENDVVYLVSEAVTMELSGFSTTSTIYGIGTSYAETNPSLLPLTVGIEGEAAIYNTNPSCEGPVVTQDPVITPNSGTISEPSVMVEITCPTEGAVIYYTLDGSTPTAESTVYTAPIEITETTTVSAIAIVEGGEPSNVVTATYTFPEIVTYPNIAAFKAAYDATSTEIVTITGDVTFVFRSGRYMYVQDETAGLLIYDNSTPVITNTYENGDVISGGITGTMNIYNGQKELVPTVNPAAGVAGTPVEPTVVTAADVVANYADYDAKLVKMEGVTFDADFTFSNSARSTTFTQDETNYTVYSRFNNLTVTVEEGQDADVIGFIGIHNDTKQMYPRNDEDIILTTPIEPETVTITATANPAIGGTVEGANEYEVGAEVTLTATAAEGYHFVNWTESDVEVGTNATLTFTAEVDRDLVANFEEDTPVEPETVTITATANPAIGGTVEGANEYEIGAEVTLTATAAEGYHFVNWTEGDAEVGTEATLTFTAEVDRDLVANFEEDTPVEPETVTITATANPAIGGTVAGAGEYEVGATVTLTANAAEGYHFVSWTEEDALVTGNPTYTFTAEVDRELVANFEEDEEPEPETYTITVLEAENGVINAPATAHEGDEITVEAIPAPLHALANLYYYTTDPEDVTVIDLTTMTFEMPAANVTIGAEFVSTAELGDANNDEQVNILDVLTVLNYILDKNPQPFDFEQADMNGDGIIDISDAMAINALIHGMKADCGEETALYDVVNGMLTIESPVALAGYQFSLSAEPASIELEGFTTMGNWSNGEYILVVFNLNGEKEAGLYEVLNIEGAMVNSVALATMNGCKVNAEKGTLSVNNLEATFNVYPVPAKDIVTVEGNGINSIEVFNVMGQRVMTAHTNEVNVSNLAAGTYMFRINTENGQVTKNVVVVK